MKPHTSRPNRNRTNCMQEPLERRTLFSAGMSVVPLPSQWVSHAQFMCETAPHAIQFAFSQDVSQTLDPSDLMLINAWSRQVISQDAITMHYDANTNAATFFFTGLENQILPDGEWMATLSSEGVFGPGEPPQHADFTFGFFFLQGDANRDGAVDLLDFNIVAANFGQKDRSFGQGDLNYDGNVDRGDFDILASRLGNRIGSFSNEPMATASVSKDPILTELV